MTRANTDIIVALLISLAIVAIARCSPSRPILVHETCLVYADRVEVKGEPRPGTEASYISVESLELLRRDAETVPLAGLLLHIAVEELCAELSAEEQVIVEEGTGVDVAPPGPLEEILGKLASRDQPRPTVPAIEIGESRWITAQDPTPWPVPVEVRFIGSDTFASLLRDASTAPLAKRFLFPSPWLHSHFVRVRGSAIWLPDVRDGDGRRFVLDNGATQRLGIAARLLMVIADGEWTRWAANGDPT